MCVCVLFYVSRWKFLSINSLSIYLSIYLSFDKFSIIVSFFIYLELLIFTSSIHYLSIYLSIYLTQSVYVLMGDNLSIYLSIYLINLFISLSLSLSIYLSIYLSVCSYLASYRAIYLSQSVYVLMGDNLSINLSINHSVHISLSLYLSVCSYLSIYLSISVSSLSIWFCSTPVQPFYLSTSIHSSVQNKTREKSLVCLPRIWKTRRHFLIGRDPK